MCLTLLYHGGLKWHFGRWDGSDLRIMTHWAGVFAFCFRAPGLTRISIREDFLRRLLGGA
jgi:hypothetical protein